MRSHAIATCVPVLIGALALGGCLVSETPMLDAKNARARPFPAGDYVGCSYKGGVAEENDCNSFSIEVGGDGLYRFIAPDEDDTLFRFRRVGRKQYAAQAWEEGDDYSYFYAFGDRKEFSLVMMGCEQLPEALRDRLVAADAMSRIDNDYGTCTVKELSALTAAARAYQKGETDRDEWIEIRLTPAPAAE